MSDKPRQCFVCMKSIGGYPAKTDYYTITVYKNGSLDYLALTYTTRTLMYFGFYFTTLAGCPLYVLAVEDNITAYTNYGFWDAKRMLEFAEIVLPPRAQLQYVTSRSNSFCDQLLEHCGDYPGVTEYVEFNRILNDPPAQDVEPINDPPAQDAESTDDLSEQDITPPITPASPSARSPSNAVDTMADD